MRGLLRLWLEPTSPRAHYSTDWPIIPLNSSLSFILSLSHSSPAQPMNGGPVEAHRYWLFLLGMQSVFVVLHRSQRGYHLPCQTHSLHLRRYQQIMSVADLHSLASTWNWETLWEKAGRHALSVKGLSSTIGTFMFYEKSKLFLFVLSWKPCLNLI